MWQRLSKLNSRRVLVLLSNSARTYADGRKCLNYKFDSPEKKKLDEALRECTNMSVPIYVGAEKFFSGDEQHLHLPHNHQQLLARFYYCNRTHISKALQFAMDSKRPWRNTDAAERARIWRKCADILSDERRYTLNAAIMLGLAKTAQHAEEDTCQLIDGLRNTADLLEVLDAAKVERRPGQDSPLHYQLRPLDGFVVAIGPFNMACVSAEVALCPTLMGNCVLWKPAKHCVLASYVIYLALLEAGLPPGVISFVPCNPKLFIDCITRSPYLAGVNFTGRLDNCRRIWQDVFFRLHDYQTLPRLVANCGGKNFHFVHESADVDIVVAATTAAAFDYAGQRRGACSRMYVPRSLWPELKCALQQATNAIRVGDPCDFSVQCSAVINELAFDRIVGYLLYAQKSPDVDVVAGGDFCKTLGYFIEPTVLECRDPTDRLLTDELLGPVLSIYVYENCALDGVLDLIEETSSFAYAGSIFAAADHPIVAYSLQKLRMTADNLYINGKCCGSLEGVAPPSGDRLSSSNDYPSPPHRLLRWSAPQLIEESFANGG